MKLYHGSIQIVPEPQILHTSIVRKIESLYMQDAERQVKAAQKNVLVDYKELNQLRGDYESLSDSSHQQELAYRLLLDQLSIPSLRVQVLAIADALIGGRPIPVSGGGGGSTSDLRWDGRNPNEEVDAYHRRCLLQASKMVGGNGAKRKRKHLHFVTLLRQIPIYITKNYK